MRDRLPPNLGYPSASALHDVRRGQRDAASRAVARYPDAWPLTSCLCAGDARHGECLGRVPTGGTQIMAKRRCRGRATRSRVPFYHRDSVTIVPSIVSPADLCRDRS
jgi:hypothetical protein